MATVNEIYAQIDRMAPFATQMDFDNAGFLVGRGETEVKRLLVALDITEEVAGEAAELGCQLIVSHHPVIFHPVKALTDQSVTGRILLALSENRIAAICAHTNLDAAEGGVNDILCKLMGVQDVRPLDTLARIGRVRATTAPQLAQTCKDVLGAHVKLVDSGKPINTLAVVGGAGGDFLPAAVAAGADALLTGEASHHVALDAKHAGLSLLVAGHYATEMPIVPVLADKLAKRFAGTRVLCSRRNKDPFTYL